MMKLKSDAYLPDGPAAQTWQPQGALGRPGNPKFSDYYSTSKTYDANPRAPGPRGARSDGGMHRSRKIIPVGESGSHAERLALHLRLLNYARRLRSTGGEQPVRISK